jgi:hypothetical protein
MDETNKQMDVLDDKFKTANARMSRLLEQVCKYSSAQSRADCCRRVAVPLVGVC